MTLDHVAAAATDAAEIVAAVGVLLGALVAVVRRVILKPLTDHVDQRVDGLEAKVEERLRPIEYQLHPNGGGSMRDAVKRIEAKVDGVGLSLTAYEAKTSTFMRAQATALSREGVDVPRPEDFGIE